MIMRIAISTILTDSYWSRYETLKKSIDNYFLKNHDVKFFTYTNKSQSANNIFNISHLPSPLITLMKFNYLIQQQDVYKNFDLIYFIDGDCEVVNVIDEEIFPTDEMPIVVTKHPWQHYNSTLYDENPSSTAYVNDSGNNHYLQACFFGGYVEDVINMSVDIHTLIKEDLKKRYIAKWFDESYMNKYLLNKSLKFLDCGYAYPTTSIWKQNFNVIPKITHDNQFSI